jgi:hypothetical protein
MIGVRGFVRRLLVRMVALGTVLSTCAPEAERPEVRIIEPADGDTVVGDVEMKLSASGIEITPASDHRPGTAHHHLFVDREVTPAGEKMPSGTAGLIHLGKGDSAFTIQDLAPGEHRVIAVLGDSAHVPLDPFTADTITLRIATPAP